MSARSLQQQEDILRILLSDPRFANVAIFSEARGVTESEVDLQLAPRRVRGGAKAGLVLIVIQPTERPDPKQAQPILLDRVHAVRIIEVPEVNRKSGGTQIPADLAKDYVMQRLQLRYLGKAALMWAGCDPWEDKKGGYGWEVAFEIRDDLETEERGATPIVAIAGGNCTLTGAGTPGEVIYYTVDGTAPVPGNDGVSVYAAPFAVASGTTVRASTVATGKALSDFNEETAP